VPPYLRPKKKIKECVQTCELEPKKIDLFGSCTIGFFGVFLYARGWVWLEKKLNRDVCMDDAYVMDEFMSQMKE